MAKKTIADDLLELPWWVSFIGSLLVYIVGSFVLPVISFENPIFQAFNGAAQALVIPVAIALACISVFSFIGSAMGKRHRKALFDKQKNRETISDLSWDEFERLIGEYFSRHGYTVAENKQKGADGGVDLRLVKDGKIVIVQCKHWKGKVGVGVIRELLGAMTALGANGALVVTSGEYTQSAKSFAAENDIGLIDGVELSRYFQSSRSFPIDTTSSNQQSVRGKEVHCPNCGSMMVRRKARKGSNAGKEFYGCSKFPKCRGIRGILGP